MIPRHPTVASLRLPDAGFDLAIPMAIDAQIRALSGRGRRRITLAPVWKTERQAIDFGRRLVDRAFKDTIGPHDERMKATWIEEWRRISVAAAQARDALRVLLRDLNPTDVTFSDANGLAQPLRRMVQEERPDMDITEAHQEARVRAADMLSALRTLSAMPDHLERHRRELSAEHQYAGEVEKAAFVMCAAAGWARLTGAPPGRGQDPDASPFIGFLDAVWSDLGGEPTSFAGMVKRLDKEAVQAKADDWARSDEDGWSALFETNPSGNGG